VRPQHDYPNPAREDVGSALADCDVGADPREFGDLAATHRVVDQQDSQLWNVKEHILILAAIHPNLLLAPKAREVCVDGFQTQFPDDWTELQNPNSEITDEWDARHG